MEYRRPHADQRRGDQNDLKRRGEREQDQADQGKPHADHEGKRLWPPVRIEADKRLKHRRGELKGQGNQADLGETQLEGFLQERVDRREQRLDHVVEEMAEAQRPQYRKRGLLGFLPGERNRSVSGTGPGRVVQNVIALEMKSSASLEQNRRRLRVVYYTCTRQSIRRSSGETVLTGSLLPRLLRLLRAKRKETSNRLAHEQPVRGIRKG